jgi:TonB family protein
MLGFTVTRSGATSGISVLSASPPGVFDQVAKEAVAKWRYQAQPIDRPGQRARIRFQLR